MHSDPRPMMSTRRRLLGALGFGGRLGKCLAPGAQRERHQAAPDLHAPFVDKRAAVA